MCDREEVAELPASSASPNKEMIDVTNTPPVIQKVSRRHLSECSNEANSSPPDQNAKTLRKAKSVSFHSTPRAERKPKSVQECLQYMVSGDTLIKIRNNLREFPRFFTLTDDLDAIRWVPSKKAHKAKVMVSSIKEIRVGCSTAVFRNCDFNDRLTEECAFSIIYGEDYESLDLLARSAEDANIWVTGLQALIAPEGIESGRGAVREKWLAEMFASAAGADSPDCLEVSEAVELVRRLADSDVVAGDIQQRLAQKEYGRGGEDCQAKLTSRQFIELFKEVATRPDVDLILFRHSNKEYMNLYDLHMFLESEQGMKGLNKEQCEELVRKYEPNPESRQNGQLMVDGFMRYLLSSECDVFSSAETSVCQDMERPLTHYFISSSHNTYLLQDQLQGCSSVEGFQRALCTGCRCVKVDCWDGSDGQPDVYHGNTLTTRISFSGAVTTIKQFAFAVSDYPLFVHLENHCSVTVQHRIADLLQEHLGDLLYQHPDDSQCRVVDLSPQQLKNRIIILGKKLSDSSEDDPGQVSDEEDEGLPQSSLMPPATASSEPRTQMALCRRLSDLISIRTFSVKSTLSSLLEQEKDVEMVSLSESLASSLCQSSPEQLINLSKTCLIRVFPGASRVDSSNFNPQDFWNVGLQMVALNHQTPGTMMDLYDGQFRRNGCCGFVLKPAVLRDVIGFYSPISKEPLPGVTPKLLRIKVISGQQLAKPRGSSAKGSVVDPYVVVQVFGAPVDCTEVRGRTVSDGGNCPIFDESFELFISVPQLCMVRFLVLDDDFIGDDFIGQFTVPLECLQTGYRHVSLLSNTGELLDRSTLFVHIFFSTRLPSSELKRKTKNERTSSELRLTGIKDVDDFFKTSVAPLLVQTQKTCSECSVLLRRVQCECGVASTAGLRQCARVILQRVATCDVSARCTITEHDGVPMLQLLPSSPSCSSTSSLPTSPPLCPAPVQRALLQLQSACADCRRLVDSCHLLSSRLLQQLGHVTDTAGRLEHLCDAGGMKERKRDRAREAFTWNARLLQAQVDLLEESRCYALQQLDQMRSSEEMVDKFNQIRPPSSRDRPRIALSPLLTRTISQPPSCQTPSPNPSARPEIRPKSILKKCHSSGECVSLGQQLTLSLSPRQNDPRAPDSNNTAL